MGCWGKFKNNAKHYRNVKICTAQSIRADFNRIESSEVESSLTHHDARKPKLDLNRSDVTEINK
jgi:hypothetical protein